MEAASVPCCLSIRFHRGSEEAEVPASSARLIAMGDGIPGHVRADLCQLISAFHCGAERGQGAGRWVSPGGVI